MLNLDPLPPQAQATPDLPPPSQTSSENGASFDSIITGLPSGPNRQGLGNHSGLAAQTHKTQTAPGPADDFETVASPLASDVDDDPQTPSADDAAVLALLSFLASVVPPPPPAPERLMESASGAGAGEGPLGASEDLLALDLASLSNETERAEEMQGPFHAGAMRPDPTAQIQDASSLESDMTSLRIADLDEPSLASRALADKKVRWEGQGEEMDRSLALGTGEGGFASVRPARAGLNDVALVQEAPRPEPKSAGPATTDPKERRVSEAAKGGIDGAKGAVSLMTAERFIPARAPSEQSLPSAGGDFPMAGPPIGQRPSSDSSGTHMALTTQVIGSAPAESSPSEVAPAELAMDPVSAVERVQAHLEHAVISLKRLGNEAMTVVLRPDAGTEMELQLSMRDGVVNIEAQFRRGDFSFLNTHWIDLQQSLSTQGVRLGSLQDAGAFTAAATPWADQDKRERAPEQMFAEDQAGRPTRPSHSEAARATAPARATPRMGRFWESWA